MNKSHKTDSNYIIRVEGKNAFRRGDTFDTFEQVAERLRAHTQESLVYYWTRDSRLVKFAHRKVSRKLNEAIQYYSIRFSCIFGGQRFKSKANGLRPCKRQTRQIDCPAFISLRATKCGRKLEVIDVCNDHTHEITEQAVKELPQKRRPSQKLLEEIYELLHLNIDKKTIIDYVKQKENKNILKKDLFNMTTHLGLSRTRSEEEQKSILQRIHQTATQDVIQHAVINRFFQFESTYSLNTETFQEDLKPEVESLDIFETRTSSSAIEFPSLTPQVDLLNSTNHANQEYDELLSNRIIVDYEEESEALEENTKLEQDTEAPPIADNTWSEVGENRPTIIYEDLICGDESGYVYDELNLTKEISDVHVEEPNIKVPNSPHSTHDLDDKEEFFNDFIMMSPVGVMCPTEITLQDRNDHSEEPNLTEDEKEQDEEEAPMELQNFLPTNQNVRKNSLSKYASLKTRRRIMKCRSCGTNARLIKMQMSYLRQQRLKLYEETQVLRLKKLKLKAEIDAINSGLM
ncbi:uncharacterized protein LOC129917694 [Episyrphus balteatus]|uniref:uncharacterized protein LOC129917694 n=1 Tax=Episyrphus balteatus TaxID=286459 RepID=UPI002484E1CE|nr:uncharacterized protein LOC129917694 [Episyrphus balteatus]